MANQHPPQANQQDIQPVNQPFQPINQQPPTVNHHRSQTDVIQRDKINANQPNLQISFLVKDYN